jgi:hypothetical protein
VLAVHEEATPDLDRPSPRETSGRGWAVLAVCWSLVFAAPHLFWAAGGRAGLGAQSAAADAALEQTWFAVYNLAAAFLALAGAVTAVALANARTHPRLRRWLSNVAAGASVVLLLRGAAGSLLIVLSLLDGTFDQQTPAILLAIEPWFVLGGVAYGGLTLGQRRRDVPAD